MSDVVANRYVVRGLLGEGAMGRVLHVHDPVDDRDVALKQILGITRAPTADGQQPSLDGEASKSELQFKQEFRLMTSLRHPNCCQVFDYGSTAHGEPFFTMEIVPGRGLDELLPLSPAAFRPILLQLLQALGYVHQLGFVHCDIKSANVRVMADGTVKLMDFGLMELAGRAVGIRGTVPYIAPEMLQRAPLDRRADLYSVGALAYEVLTGAPPFTGATALEVLRKHVSQAPVPLGAAFVQSPDVPAAVVLRLLAKEPGARFSAAEAALEALGVAGVEGTRGGLLVAALAGRSAELAGLEAHIQALGRGEPGTTVWLQGAGGAGKSRLAEEVRFGAQLAGLGYAVGRAPAGGGPPFGVAIALLRGLLPMLRMHAPQLLTAAAGILVKLLPELAVAPTQELDTPAREKLRLFVTIADVLGALAAKLPQVLVFEDWQWAGTPDRELVQFLARNLQTARVLVLVLAREDAPEDVPCSHIRLGPLDAPAMTRMLEGMLGTEALDAGLVAAQARVTAGIPGHIVRLFEYMHDSGHLVLRAGRWTTDRDIEALALPADVHGLAMLTLSQVSAATRRVAAVAALLGQGFTLDALRHVTALPEAALFDALLELERLALITRTDEAHLSVADEGLKQALVAEIVATDRQALHARMAEFLLWQGGDRPPARLPLELCAGIAHHLLAAAAPALQVLPFALDAGRRSAALHANEDAERLLAAGLAIVEQLPVDDGAPYRLAFLTEYGDLQRVAGQAARAREILTAAVALAEQLQRSAGLGRLLASLAKACQVLDDYGAASAYALRAIAACTSDGDSLGAARAMLVAARIDYFRGERGAAIATTERALALARASAEPISISAALAFLGYLCVVADHTRIEAGIDFLHESVALLETAGDNIGLNNALSLLGNAYLTLGSFIQAGQTFARARDLCLRIGYQSEGCFARLNLGISLVERGAFAEGLAELELASDSARHLNARYPLSGALAYAAFAAACGGQLRHARGQLAEALDLAVGIGNAHAVTAVRLMRAQVAATAGNPQEVQAEALALAEQDLGEDERARLWLLQAEAHQSLGAGEQSQALAAHALHLARANLARATEARALGVLARRAMAKGEWPEAARLAEEGRQLAVAREISPLVASLAGLQGECALALGVPDEAFAHFEQMLTNAEAMGAPALVARALFGLAAARPYAPEARTHVSRAQATLLALQPAFDEADWLTFSAIPANQRVMAGNHVGFGLPQRTAQRAPGRSPTGPLQRPFGPF